MYRILYLLVIYLLCSTFQFLSIFQGCCSQPWFSDHKFLSDSSLQHRFCVCAYEHTVVLLCFAFKQSLTLLFHYRSPPLCGIPQAMATNVNGMFLKMDIAMSGNFFCTCIEYSTSVLLTFFRLPSILAVLSGVIARNHQFSLLHFLGDSSMPKLDAY